MKKDSETIIENLPVKAAKTKAVLDEKQITLQDALILVDSNEVSKFDIHYRHLAGDANYYVKENIYYSDCLEENPDKTIEDFISNADNYGSFWLSVWFGADNENYNMFQIVDNENFEPL